MKQNALNISCKSMPGSFVKILYTVHARSNIELAFVVHYK